MADYLPKFKPGAAVTFTASDVVTGGRLQILTGARTCKNATADSAVVLGVAGFDVVSGDLVTVFLRPTGVHSLVASAAIAVGDKVISAAAGKVATIGGGTNSIGIALTAATDPDDVIDVLFL